MKIEGGVERCWYCETPAKFASDCCAAPYRATYLQGRFQGRAYKCGDCNEYCFIRSECCTAQPLSDANDY